MIEPKDIFHWKADGENKFTWTVPDALPYFDGHFPSQPVLPGVAIVDGTFEALKTLQGERTPRLSSAKFKSVVLPGHRVQLRLQAKDLDHWEATWWVEQKSGDSQLAADLRIEF